MQMTFVLPFILFFFSGFLGLIVSNKKILSSLFIISSLTSFLINLFFFSNFEQNLSYYFGNFAREIGIEYSLNKLNSGVLTLVSFLIFIFSIFLNGFIRGYEKDFHFGYLFLVLNLMCGASMAVLMTSDLFNFYIFFELIAICSYILISLGNKGGSYAALNYLILGVLASGFIVIGIGFLFFNTGYLNIFKIKEILTLKEVNLLIPFTFVLIGFLIKLAVFPFSFWPSLVYKHFPPALISLYAGIVSVVTFYGFYFFFSNFFADQNFISNFKNLILLLACVGVLMFSFFSIYENDVRKIFAYSTISQVSYSLFVLFLQEGSLVSISIIHLISNGITKLALFIILFEIVYFKGNYMISAFDGIGEKSKTLAITILFLFANLIGLPLTLGFSTKLSFIIEAFKTGDFIFCGLILVGAFLSFLYLWKMASVMFFRKRTEDVIIDFAVESKISIFLAIMSIIFLTLFFNQAMSAVQNLF